ncbi:uncharacterized protein LOC134217721 [Armigeres subalbatus]|uniref:uncharacterized protein LOC134217721 n=1 Tax=Armigeres subalbatus TaxID=124917 RepID=UPI002ED2B7FD
MNTGTSQTSRLPKEGTSNHDNGAVGCGTTNSPKRKAKVKVTKKMLLEELTALKSELATVRAEKEATTEKTSSVGNDGVNFKPRETFEVYQDTSSGHVSLLATMSNMSFGSLNIPECRPSEGETDLDKKAYEHWKEILNASFNLVQATDEQAKMDIFRIKAGAKLLEVMQGTSSIVNMPNERTHPFTNAIARLDNYFGSRTYIIGQRGKLMNMVHHSNESSVAFVRRVAASAKLCGYKCEEEMEAVVRTIVKGTTDSRVRILAHRNWVNQGDMNSLISMVRDREMEMFNEEEYQKLNRQSIAAIAAETTEHRGAFRRGIGTRFRGFQRGRGTFRRVQPQFQGTSRSSCWRCASMYHGPSVCPNIDKVCHTCKRRGHLARTCATVPQLGAGQKRASNDLEDEEPRPKIAAIKQNGEDIDEKVKDNVDPE